MIYSEKTRDIVAEYTSLSLTIDKLLERQEKDWGCFQVKKEGEFYSLFVPALPSFKFYQNPKSLIYRGYWRERELPNPTDTKSFPPDLWIKKKNQKVTIRQNAERNKIEHRELQLIDRFDLDAQANKAKKLINVEKKQRIYEIVYRYNPAVEIRAINQLIADFLKEKIKANIVSVPENEIFPLIIVGNSE
jgi:hypothetical protein